MNNAGTYILTVKCKKTLSPVSVTKIKIKNLSANSVINIQSALRT